MYEMLITVFLIAVTAIGTYMRCKSIFYARGMAHGSMMARMLIEAQLKLSEEVNKATEEVNKVTEELEKSLREQELDIKLIKVKKEKDE
jgi:CRISPR/Cas system-associated exonuclease Cas4 (RecB family)